MYKIIRLFLLLQLTTACGKKDVATVPAQIPVATTDSTNATFSNPVISNGPDPWVIQQGEEYYYTHTMGNRIGIYKTEAISQLDKVKSITIWTPPANQLYSKDIWAPELHYLSGKWYFYFAADDGNDVNHRMYVLENSAEDPIAGDWEFKGKLYTPSDKWAIDGTVFNYEDNLYFIWSGWRGDNDPGIQQLYIAKMTNPWTLEGERVMISEPSFDWEKNGLVNEGPEVLKNDEGKVFLIYSASGCWTDNYNLGMMYLEEGGDPLNPEAWHKYQKPVFTKSPENGAYGPGHNSFFKSPDGRENWIIYHANPESGQGCGGNRSTRMQKFTWNEEGEPEFGVPVSINKEISRPSGEETE